MVTLTSEQGKLLHAISSVSIEGSTGNLKSALQVAQLVLKHRQNSNQHQRIVAFVGSPLQMSVEEATMLSKVLRKNNVAVDVVSFGAINENDAVLEALMGEQPEGEQDPDEANRLLRVFQGQGSVVETLAASPIVRGSSGAAAANGGDFPFGVDPEMDPELALALKLSMEEEMARQSKQQPATEKEADKEEEEPPQTMEVDEEDEDALLQQAIALSMQTAQQEQDKPQ